MSVGCCGSGSNRNACKSFCCGGSTVVVVVAQVVLWLLSVAVVCNVVATLRTKPRVEVVAALHVLNCC